jgi:YhcH/YjgK/YiaL family protein
MAIFGSISTVRAQLAQADKFSPVFAYLNECFRAGSAAQKRLDQITAGQQERIELPGGAFALEQAYQSKQRHEGFFESHKKYIDVQVIVAGREIIEVADVGRLKLKEDRTPEKDLLVYEMATAGSTTPLFLQAGDAAVLFPVDGHMPGLSVAETAFVRKIVVKVPVA